jgi:phage gpG-like protein
MEENFEKGGWQADEGLVEPWKPRKNDEGKGRGVLIGKQSGRLMKSGKIFKADPESVVVGVPDNIAEYGKIHNEGGDINVPVTPQMKKFFWAQYYKQPKKKRDESKWKFMALTKKKQFRVSLPRRQFLGVSPALTKRIVKFFNESFSQNLKGNL